MIVIARSVLVGLVLAASLIGCSPQTPVQPPPSRPSQVSDATPSKSASPSASTTESKRLTLDTLLSTFPECSKERALVYKSDSVLTFAVWRTSEGQVVMSIDPDGKYVEYAEIGLTVAPGTAAKMTDKRLEPLERFLSTLFPERSKGLEWLRGAFGRMPYTETIDNWEVKVWESSSENGLFVTASEGKSAPVQAEISPRDFEKLVVVNGQSVVTGASVEDGNGKALTRQSSKLLGVWVSSAWYQFTDVQKKYFIKIHVDAFNEWKGDDKGIVIFFDSYLKEELGSGTSLGITLKK